MQDVFELQVSLIPRAAARRDTSRPGKFRVDDRLTVILLAAQPQQRLRLGSRALARRLHCRAQGCPQGQRLPHRCADLRGYGFVSFHVTLELVYVEAFGGSLTNHLIGIKSKVENKEQYQQYLKELEPLRQELGVLLKEDLYPETTEEH